MNSTEIEDWIVTHVADKLQTSADSINREIALTCLGLDSVSMMGLAGELAEYTGTEIQVSLIWEYPTITKLAEAIAQQSVNSSIESAPPTEARHTPQPLTFAQERVWKYANHQAGGDHNVLLHCWSLQGKLKREALEAALDQVVDRHEILRTRFTISNNTPAQIVEPRQEALLRFMDLSECTSPKQEAIDRLRQEESQSMQITGGPLFDVQLLKLDEGEHIIFFKFHHLIFDANSLAIFYTQLSQFYNAYGHVPQKLPQAMQVVDYALWQREHLNPKGSEYSKLLLWWLDHWMKEPRPPKLKLPCKRRRADPEASIGKNEIIAKLPDTLLSQSRGLAQEIGTTPYMVFFAAFNALLHKLSGNEIITLGSYVSDRNQPAANLSMGFFINLLGLRIELKKTMTFKQLIQSISQTMEQCSVHQQLPFETLVKELEKRGHKRPRVEVIFQQIPALKDQFNFQGIEAERWSEADPIKTLWGLTVELMSHADAIHVRMRFDPTRYDTDKVEVMLQQYLQILETLLAEPDQRIPRKKLLAVF